MTHELADWLDLQAKTLCAATIHRAPNMLPDEQDVAELLEMMVKQVSAARDEQLSAIQSWAMKSIGSDAMTASDWLIILRVLKEEIGNCLSQQFSPEETLKHWRLLDTLFTFLIIEAAQLTSYMGKAELLEHTVQLRDKLERLERSKSNFITVGAHELRTPLTIVEGYANMLRVETESNSSLRLYVNGLDNGLIRMQEIIGDMIDVSLLDLQSFELTYQQINVEKTILLVTDNMSKHFAKRRINLVFTPFEGNQATYGDPQKLVKAFEKVLSNALKYTPDGGRIKISGRLMEASDRSRDIDGQIRVEIQDSGIGIDSENLESIFDKFSSVADVRLHSSSKTAFRGGGAGLGLPITKGIIEAHGGRIWAESPGYDGVNFPGSSFFIELPVYLNPPVSVDDDL